MAWPENLESITTNLEPEEFTVVKFAIDHDLVEWEDNYELIIALGSYSFEFLGKKYLMEEIYEIVSTLKRKEKE
jgi:hypothetical protein